MTGVADTQAPLEAVLKDEILRMYQAVADQPESTFHFFHGREAAELFGYEAGLARSGARRRGCVLRGGRESPRAQPPATG